MPYGQRGLAALNFDLDGLSLHCRCEKARH